MEKNTSDNLEQARNACATAMEHFVKFVYHSAIAIGLVVQTLYLWLKETYQERAAACQASPLERDRGVLTTHNDM